MKGSVFKHVLSATRMHFPPDADCIPPATEEHLRAYLRSIQKLGIQAAIAVNAQQARVQKIAEEIGLSDLEVLHVPVWGVFVPALNALLGAAQRRKMRFVVYQSLEVQYSPEVLQFLLNHITKETLVVGPVLDGHTFSPGEQALNGRTAPWNTLAVWATRKLALTGFLSIADGLPAFDGSKTSYLDIETTNGATMGSDAWWKQSSFSRQISGEPVIPAGVEEVTAIALLQHLLGQEKARALLVLLPEALYEQVSWKASWAGDEGRRKWHEEKMASKVSRPRAQLKQLFSFKKSSTLQQSLLPNDATPGGVGGPPSDKPDEQQDGEVAHGVVLHFEQSIPPSRKVWMVSLGCVFLFSVNVSMVFASAFSAMNGAEEEHFLPSYLFVALLLGGIYLPMPVSVWLTRKITLHANHSGGFIFFLCTQLIAHPLIIFWELRGEPGPRQQQMLLLARLVQGLGSGVTFHARYVLVASSTMDHHMKAQMRSLYASDLGIAVGALLPSVGTMVMYMMDHPWTWTLKSLDLVPCFVLGCVTFAFLLWVILSFPRSPHLLPDKVRMYGSAAAVAAANGGKDAVQAGSQISAQLALLVSGTAPTVAQSLVIVALAMMMHVEGYTGDFRQTTAIAAAFLFLITCPVFVFASRCCQVNNSTVGRGCLAMLCIVLVLALSWPMWRNREAAVRTSVVTLQVVLLLAALSLGRPLTLSRVFQQPAPEKALAQLEWAKAYIGRLFAPLGAVLIYEWMGFEALVLAMAAVTAVIPLTA